DFLKDLEYLLQLRLMKLFAQALQSLAEPDAGALHLSMRFGRTADEKEMLVLSQSLVPIRIVQSHAQKTHDATIVLVLLVRHRACSRIKLKQGTLKEYTVRKRRRSTANPV